MVERLPSEMKWLRRKGWEADLERELRSDLELEIEEQQQRGLSPRQANFAARRAFGNSTLISESTREAWPSQPGPFSSCPSPE